ETVEGVSVACGKRETGDHFHLRLVVVTELGDEADVGISLDDVRNALDLLASGFVEQLGLGGVAAVAVHAAEVATGADDEGIEEAGLLEAAGGELLEADA